MARRDLGMDVAATAGGIAAEAATKISLFYLHERAWARVWWGRTPAPVPEAGPVLAAPMVAPAAAGAHR